jgi:hypothetical protein
MGDVGSRLDSRRHHIGATVSVEAGGVHVFQAGCPENKRVIELPERHVSLVGGSTSGMRIVNNFARDD